MAAVVLDEEQSRPFVKRALEHGINFFDTADVHRAAAARSSSAVPSASAAPGVIRWSSPPRPSIRSRRARIGRGSRKHLLDAIDASLTRLGMDYVDPYQIHRLIQRRRSTRPCRRCTTSSAGKARYIGASSMAAWQFAKMLHLAERNGGTRFVSMQNHYNLIYREEEREMLPLCREEGIGVIPWSPLARGFLAGNRRKADRGETARARTDEFAQELYYADDDFAVADRTAEVAKRIGARPTQVALAWLLSKPSVTAPIIGASKVTHLNEAVESLQVQLSADDIKLLEEPYRPHRVLGH